MFTTCITDEVSHMLNWLPYSQQTLVESTYSNSPSSKPLSWSPEEKATTGDWCSVLCQTSNLHIYIIHKVITLTKAASEHI